MNSLIQLLTKVSNDLHDVECRWALIGGLAVGARTEPRFTRDIDLAVDAPSDALAERLVFGLTERGYRIAAVLEQSTNGRLATIRLLPPGDDRLVDLLFCSSGIEPLAVREAESLELDPGFEAPVATVGHLIAMKILARDDARRPQDRLDLMALIAISGEQDMSTARSALEGIVSAGLHRGRNLFTELESALVEFETPESSTSL